jgi:hypothetical protein
MAQTEGKVTTRGVRGEAWVGMLASYRRPTPALPRMLPGAGGSLPCCRPASPQALPCMPWQNAVAVKCEPFRMPSRRPDKPTPQWTSSCLPTAPAWTYACGAAAPRPTCRPRLGPPVPAASSSPPRPRRGLGWARGSIRCCLTGGCCILKTRPGTTRTGRRCRLERVQLRHSSRPFFGISAR